VIQIGQCVHDDQNRKAVRHFSASEGNERLFKHLGGKWEHVAISKMPAQKHKQFPFIEHFASATSIFDL
jgi:hypothetical protein